jgi:class 3 adenylate cyclase
MTEALGSGPISVRIGLHTGTPHIGKEGYVGDDVHFAARVASTGHGGQVVLSEATAELVELALTDLGDHRFKDIPDTVSIFRLGDDDFDPDEPLDRIPLVEEDADAREEVSSGFV